MPWCIKVKATQRWLFMLVALLLIAGCRKTETKTAATRDLRLYLTCDTAGRLEPCGCFEGQFGGLTRIKTWLDGQASGPSLRVDAGDAIAGTQDYDVLRHKQMLKAFQAMQFQALNLGAREAALSAETLKAIISASPVPLLSANVLDRATGSPLAQPWLKTTVGGLKVGIVGVVDPKALDESQRGAGVEIGDMASAISRALDSLRDDCEVRVLLAFADEEAMHQLATQFFEFQFILGGKVKQPSQDPERVNRSQLMAVTNQARAVGVIAAKLSAESPAQVVTLTQNVVFMEDSIEQNDAVMALAKAYRDDVRRAVLAMDKADAPGANEVAGVKQRATYAGTQACATCHAEGHAVWQKTGHAQAFEALVKRDSDADPHCLGCHTVGLGSASGYRREFKAAKLVDVGCESCHGPGSVHVAERTAGKEPRFKFRPLGAGDCVQCHYGEFSRPFRWEEFWPAVQHGKK